MAKLSYWPLANPCWVVAEVEQAAAVWLMLPPPAAPKRLKFRFMVAAPSDRPAKETPLTSVAGLTRLPLELKVRVPVALAEAIGSWITLPEVVIPVPTMLNCPPAVDGAVVPVMPAAAMGAGSAVVWAAIVPPAVTVGAVMVAVPLAVGPVMVRLVPGFTVPSVPPLAPKLKFVVVTPATVAELGESVLGTVTV